MEVHQNKVFENKIEALVSEFLSTGNGTQESEELIVEFHRIVLRVPYLQLIRQVLQQWWDQCPTVDNQQEVLTYLYQAQLLVVCQYLSAKYLMGQNHLQLLPLLQNISQNIIRQRSLAAAARLTMQLEEKILRVTSALGEAATTLIEAACASFSRQLGCIVCGLCKFRPASRGIFGKRLAHPYKLSARDLVTAQGAAKRVGYNEPA